MNDPILLRALAFFFHQKGVAKLAGQDEQNFLIPILADTIFFIFIS